MLALALRSYLVEVLGYPGADALERRHFRAKAATMEAEPQCVRDESGNGNRPQLVRVDDRCVACRDKSDGIGARLAARCRYCVDLHIGPPRRLRWNAIRSPSP